MRWNSFTTSIINIGQLLSVNGMNAYTEIDKETRTFATTAEFVNYLGQYAAEIATKHNLYASVMVAQASLETTYGNSKLSTVGNNLFGIKGSYAGNSIDSLPWGTPGFTMIGLTSSYLDSSVRVIQESVEGYYALVTLNGKTLGWVDKRCFCF